MFQSPYQTSACQTLLLDKLIKEIRLEHSGRQLISKVPAIVEVTYKNPTVPAFAHPLIISEDNEDTLIAIDIREHIRARMDGDSYSIMDDLGYRFKVYRAKLLRLWLEPDGPHECRIFNKMPLLIFMEWISQSLAYRLKLDPETQIQLACIIGFYYLGLFEHETTWKDQDRARMATTIGNLLRIPVARVLDYTQQVNWMDSIYSLVDTVKSILGNKRLESLNVPLIYSITGFGWQGAHSKETIAIALEHPPTWITIVAHGMTERGYRKTNISQLIKRYEKHSEAKSFEQALVSLTQ